jgi:hypothetical protein
MKYLTRSVASFVLFLFVLGNFPVASFGQELGTHGGAQNSGPGPHPQTIIEREPATKTDATGLNTSTVGPYEVTKVGSECTNENCGGCCQCTVVRMPLPLGAQIKAIRYFSTAKGGNPPKPDKPLRGVPPGELGFSRIEPLPQENTETNTVIQYRFKNWSADRTRQTKMEVDWTLPVSAAKPQ